MADFDYKVSFRVTHPSRTADEISAMLELTPRHCWNVGEPRATPKGTLLGGIRDRSYCSFPMGEGEDGRVASCVADALEALAPHDDYLSELRKTGGTFDFFIYWEADRSAGEAFPPDLLLKLGQLGIELQLDIYGPHCGPECGWPCRQNGTSSP